MEESEKKISPLRKLTVGQVFSYFSILVVLVGWFVSARSAAKEKSEQDRAEYIYRHDRDKADDSLRTAFAMFVKEFRDLQKNRTETTKQRDQEKKEDDERTDALKLDIEKLNTEFHDHLLYTQKIKQ